MIPIRDTVPRRYPPIATWGIIIANSVVFLFELALPPDLLDALFFRFGLVPIRYTNPQLAQAYGLGGPTIWPFITNMFLHAGWLHFLGNMWTLHLFGGSVEDRLGRARFLILYFLAGLGAGLCHCMFNKHSYVPAVGASGAIAGVMGAYFLMFPTAMVEVVFPIGFFPFFFQLPAIVYLGVWFVTQLYAGTVLALVQPGGSGGIAWWAHVGGFVIGIILLPLLKRRKRVYRNYYPDELYCRYC